MTSMQEREGQETSQGCACATAATAPSGAQSGGLALRRFKVSATWKDGKSLPEFKVSVTWKDRKSLPRADLTGIKTFPRLPPTSEGLVKESALSYHAALLKGGCSPGPGEGWDTCSISSHSSPGPRPEPLQRSTAQRAHGATTLLMGFQQHQVTRQKARYVLHGALVRPSPAHGAVAVDSIVSAWFVHGNLDLSVRWVL